MTMEIKPNILIFMTDQQRWDTAPPFNRAFTPNLDKFYKKAIAFTEAFCPSPHCSPSRASFFTGLYPTEHGVWNNVDVGNALSKGLYDDTRLWSDDLLDEGYKLYFTGKWHISAEETPADRGWEWIYPLYEKVKRQGHRLLPDTFEWDIYYTGAKACKGDESRQEAQIIRSGYPIYSHFGVMENPFDDGTVVEEAVKSIMEGEPIRRPWCRFVGPVGPHEPYNVPERFLKLYDINEINLPESFYDSMEDKPGLYRRTRDRYNQLTAMEHKKSIQHYLALCSYEDYLFGEVINALEQKGELDNTAIIYISDHGDYAGEHGLWAKGLACFKPAYHIPLLIHCPGKTKNPGRTVEHFASLVDIAPTIHEICGIKTDRQLSGASLLPFIEGKEVEGWRGEIYTQTNGNELYGIQRSVMTREWKYVYNGFDYDELYNLKEDPNETKNLISIPQYKDVVMDLCRKLWSFAYEHKDVCINPYMPCAHAPYGPGIIFHED